MDSIGDYTVAESGSRSVPKTFKTPRILAMDHLIMSRFIAWKSKLDSILYEVKTECSSDGWMVLTV